MSVEDHFCAVPSNDGGVERVITDVDLIEYIEIRLNQDRLKHNEAIDSLVERGYGSNKREICAYLSAHILQCHGCRTIYDDEILDRKGKEYGKLLREDDENPSSTGLELLPGIRKKLEEEKD